MKQCVECNRAFEPREPYHKYCDDCYARRQGSATRPRRPKGIPWHPSWDLWLGSDLLVWGLLIGLLAVVIYTIGSLLGFS